MECGQPGGGVGAPEGGHQLGVLLLVAGAHHAKSGEVRQGALVGLAPPPEAQESPAVQESELSQPLLDAGTCARDTEGP